MKKTITSLASLFLSVSAVYGQSISTGPLGFSAICGGDSTTIPYTESGTFVGKNEFTAEISDSTGSFSPSFLNIGSVRALSSGTIEAFIPASQPAGSHYRIRVISSNPYVVGSDNGSDLVLGQKPSAEFSVSTHYMLESDSVILTAPPGLAGYSWNFGDGAVPATSTSQSSSVMYLTPGAKTISLTVTSASGCTNSYTMAPSPYDNSNEFGLTVYSCDPAIPHDAMVDSVTQDFGTGSGDIWVVPGTTFITETGDFTVFAEPGSSVELPGTGSLTVYLKDGSSYTGGATGSHRLIYGPGAGLNNLRYETLFPCSSLSFDYSNAPPYKIVHADDVTPSSSPDAIVTYPNPASRMLFVEMPSAPTSVSLVNALGQKVITASGGLTSRLQLDVSSYSAGTYFLILNFGEKRVTREVILGH